MISMRFENMPQVRTDFSEEFREISEEMERSVLGQLAEGGKPAWQRTRYGAIPRLYDRFANTVGKDFDGASATVSWGGTPDTFAHQFGADIIQIVSNDQRNFFWRRYYETGDDMWKAMACSATLVIRLPARPVLLQPEDYSFAQSLLSDRVLDFQNPMERQ